MKPKTAPAVICEWKMVDQETGTSETSCRKTTCQWPSSDWKFCPYCGGRIKVKE